VTEPTATVIVPVYNSLHVVRPCLESVARWTDLDRHRLIIADDASDAHTQRQLETWVAAQPGSELLTSDINLGFVRNCNRAMALAETEYIVLLNSDTCVTPRWLDKMIACMESDPTIGVASPVSNFAPHLKIPMVPGADYIQMSALIEHHSQRDYPDVTTPEGFCFMVSAECLAAVGYFDVVFDRGYGEESDLSMRAVYNGFRTVCVDDTYVYHRGRASFGFETRDELYERNKQIFFKRWQARYASDFEEFKERDPIGYLRTNMANYSDSSLPSAYAR
jgi:GT2 family glycosyltransferase